MFTLPLSLGPNLTTYYRIHYARSIQHFCSNLLTVNVLTTFVVIFCSLEVIEAFIGLLLYRE